ncbi:MAG: hypothetical protein J6Y10_07330 [Lachnospiraceae bacterium]|nr:hypothetical protein [Lachnospiraceae bacterium]
MKNWFWIFGVVLGVVVLATVLYFGTGAEQPAAQEEHVPTPTNALPDNPERYLQTLSPSPTETPAPTPTVAPAETTIRKMFVLGDRTSPELTYDVELDFPERGFTKLEDYYVRVEDSDNWEKVYDIPSVATGIRFRFSGNTIFEQLGSIKEGTTEYYSYFYSSALKQDDSLVVLSVPVVTSEDSLMLYLRNDEARVYQNGRLLAAFLLKDGTIQVLMDIKGQSSPDYSRTFYVMDDGRTETIYLEETEDLTVCYDRRTRRKQWSLSRFYDGERRYHLEIRDPNSPDDKDEMIVLYNGAPDSMPTEVYGVTNTAFSLWERIEEAEKTATMPKREWEETVHTSILTSGDYGTLYMDTVYCGYITEDEKGKEKIAGTATERHFRWENPDLHMYMESAVDNPDSAIDYRMVIDDEESTSKYLLRSYAVSERRSRSCAQTPEGDVLWVEEAKIADGEPYLLTRIYADYIRLQNYQNGRIYMEEFTSLPGKRIRTTQFFYDTEGRIERTVTRDKDDILTETRDYIYDVSGDLVRTVQNSYDKNGNLTETVTYDADGNVISTETPQPGEI